MEKREHSEDLKYDQDRDGMAGRKGVLERAVSLRGQRNKSSLEFVDSWWMAGNRRGGQTIPRRLEASGE